MPDLRLRVNGKDYGGWTSIRVTRSIECVAGSFELGVTDRWAGQPVQRPILEEDECEIVIDGEVVISGHVDTRDPSFGPEERSLTISGKDRTAVLVECSAILSTWEFYNTSVLVLANLLTKPFSIPVSMQSGLSAPRTVAKLTVDPGDSVFEAIERACRSAAMLPVADGKGGLLITRAGSRRATTALVEGENIIAGSARFDATARYARYVVTGQKQGTDNDYGEDAAMVQGSSTDAGVRRRNRVLMVRAETGITATLARQRAEWEASVRAARSESATVTVQGWKQGDGTLWPINAKVPVRSKELGIDGEMLISETTCRADNGGTTTEIRLRPPNAFLPEPEVADNVGLWKELNSTRKP